MTRFHDDPAMRDCLRIFLGTPHGGAYGFDEITEIGGKIEYAAKEAQVNDIEHLIDKLSRYLDNVQVSYDE